MLKVSGMVIVMVMFVLVSVFVMVMVVPNFLLMMFYLIY